jgi:aminomethyltransferase
VVNASNTDKDLAWIREQAALWTDSAGEAPDAARIVDVSDATALLALQGPRAEEILASISSLDLTALRSFRLAAGEVAGADAVVSRTGYTGEDGFEIFAAAVDAVAVWQALRQAGHARGLLPIGLGARDSLRLEAGLCLYGHEIDETVTPLEAGLEWMVKLEAEDFIGRAALLEQRRAGVPRRLVGLELEGRRIARAGSLVWSPAADAPVGRVTSGTWSPFLERSIAMALLDAGNTAPGTGVEVEVRDHRQPALVRTLPFHRRRARA